MAKLNHEIPLIRDCCNRTSSYILVSPYSTLTVGCSSVSFICVSMIQLAVNIYSSIAIPRTLNQGWKKCFISQEAAGQISHNFLNVFYVQKNPKFYIKFHSFPPNSNISWEGASQLPHFCNQLSQKQEFLTFLYSPFHFLNKYLQMYVSNIKGTQR